MFFFKRDILLLSTNRYFFDNCLNADAQLRFCCLAVFLRSRDSCSWLFPFLPTGLFNTWQLLTTIKNIFQLVNKIKKKIVSIFKRTDMQTFQTFGRFSIRSRQLFGFDGFRWSFKRHSRLKTLEILGKLKFIFCVKN